MKFLRRLAKNNSGSTMIEFALVAPVFFTLVLGTLEYSLIMHVSSLVEHSTHEGARYAMTGNEYSDINADAGSRTAFIKQQIRSLMLRWLDNKDITAEDEQLQITAIVFPDFESVGLDGGQITSGEFGGGANQVVMYNILYQYKILTPFLGSLYRTGENSDGESIFEMTSTVLIKNECFTGGFTC